MNIMYGVIAVVGVGGVALMFANRQPADVYAMPVNEVYARLANVDFGSLGEGERTLNTVKTARGNGTNMVTWTERGDMAGFECQLGMRPWEEDTNNTLVSVTCAGGGAGDGAAAGMVHNMHRNEVIERIDATLTGRQFSPERAGAAAEGWPGDGVDGSLGAATDRAFEMQNEMQQMRREVNNMPESQSNAAREAQVRAMQRSASRASH